MFDEIEIDESSNFSNIKIQKEIESVYLLNDQENDMDMDQFRDNFSRIKNINQIKSMIIDPSSRVKDLLFLENMPNLEYLIIHGKHIENLTGIDGSEKLDFLEIDTVKNKRRNIEALSQTRIASLKLKFAKSQDLEVLNHCPSIKDLEIIGCADFDPELIKEMNIERLDIVRAKNIKLSNFNKLRKLTKLHIAHCNKLSRFENNNENISFLIVQTCNSLDLETIRSFPNLETLLISSCKKPFSMGFINSIKPLNKLTIEYCKLEIPLIDYKIELKNFDHIFITPAKKELLKKLSQLNKDVTIENEKFCFINGVAEA
ncbi:hypothetical protein D1BOALGB6SA_391 [Olavius sp. associated proteobacterium Delta 1]|nr:hypothetical protein D1BOALGB6SA_391 [Olavius sp. associated proteobacterium Delta 1]